MISGRKGNIGRWMAERHLRIIQKRAREKVEEDCPICHGAGATTDHHDPCTECGGSGKVGGGIDV